MIHYLRGLASLAVAWFHLTNQWSDAIRTSGSFGWLGVEVFFVISGFVIPYSISITYQAYSMSAFRSFISRRIVRIEVPYLTSIILVIMLGHLSALAPGFHGPAQSHSAAQILSNIFYIAAWTGEHWLQPVYWTLAFEFAFYLTIGLLYCVVFGQGRSLMYSFVVSAILLTVIGGAVSYTVLLFVIGTAVFRNVMGQDHYFATISTVFACVATIAFVGSMIIALVGLMTAIAIRFGKEIHVDGWLGRLLAYLGTISYSLYLVHVPVGGRAINLSARFVHSPFGHLVASGVALAIALGFAHVFYVLIERPAQRKAQQLFFMRHERETRGFAC